MKSMRRSRKSTGLEENNGDGGDIKDINLSSDGKI